MIVRYGFFLLLFAVLVFEGTVYQVFAPDFYGFPYSLIPRFLFVMIVFAGIYRGRGYALFYGILFGAVYDIVYSQVLGVYTFGMAFFAYILSMPIPAIKRSLPLTVTLIMVGFILLEYFVYGMMILTESTELPHNMFLYNRLLPSAVMNALFITVIAHPLRLWFEYIERHQNDF
ncbi:rod shape-determining protein MreD [Salisediminibacterium halotolerans]|uniref:Rod shape-determining protein MreD n=1 Tax=Salisediminibacterium halotolerans TaxID=517425 RepID=A0A1H9R2Y2_9BACI|nr:MULTISPECIES: rod shape-determining protein MreD [Salisediminibacterium]RLJ78220.1 rod shape-determining protein MreD [Actinophytocola xinjiangensis]RPE88441.1 rod shape-determining protein MreD [Salisediminibacterium halotolerans]TWG37197.1 rod shape-determining protein MreD [Salisediminibacterium halotolerans]SER66977.1 rod shape-determining protein MreD [Salisediminibacterium haloalkalitolerans]GEL07131.1 rod shape-determining protein MreD [Salisediminibacterium halotolerans]